MKILFSIHPSFPIKYSIHQEHFSHILIVKLKTVAVIFPGIRIFLKFYLLTFVFLLVMNNFERHLLCNEETLKYHNRDIQH
ncbi:hypothetical protein T4D_12105 [Trichinella pseudospiralis]|uniref:Uncharacterized protein n=1 Tax=Trichinella pseudospiralis TaxID=6337 RepID=A0A0V1FFN2_TRIPS|nr:hypothetical protein T4D_12105 [Trichinella pseudospiralis]